MCIILKENLKKNRLRKLNKSLRRDCVQVFIFPASELLTVLQIAPWNAHPKDRILSENSHIY